VGVRIDEAGREDAALAVDAGGRRVLAFELILRADGDDPFAIGCDGGVREDAGVAQLGCAARARRAGAGDDLSGVDEESLRWHLSRIYVAKSDG
jgi:hypothetical protein